MAYTQPTCEECVAPATLKEGGHLWFALCYIRIHKLVLKGLSNGSK